MRPLVVAAALGLALVFWPASDKAQAQVGFGIHFGSPYHYGYGYPHWGYRPYWRHRPYWRYHRPYYYGYRYYPRYRHRRYHRRHYSPRYYRGGSCSYWARQCARNWGRGGPNWRGCMRYHRCY